MPYVFEAIDRFRDRVAELDAIKGWFDRVGEPRALVLHGRRRVGKSWLFKAFAHGREADVLIGTTRALPDQLAGFAATLERDGERPDLPDLETLFRTLYRRAHTEPRLAVIDELPNLLRVDRALPSTLLKIMEEESPNSRLKLILTGSHVGIMEELLAERQPLHDRLQPLRIRPLDFWRAQELLEGMTPENQLVAFGLAGGMPKYLAVMAGSADPAASLAATTLDPLAGLFNEGRAVLAQELESPATYFSLLAALAAGPADYPTIAGRSHVEHNKIGRYLATLEGLDLVSSRYPVTDPDRRSRVGQYRLNDGFLRFWFRWVFPFEDDLAAGLNPAVVLDDEIRPRLADHLAPAIEDVARDWVRRNRIGAATRVGAWWGPALNELRATNERTTEEIDIVGLRGKRAVVVGEVRWRSEPMSVAILGELERFKLPALRQAGIEVKEPRVVLVSRSGFSDGLREAAIKEDRIQLVSLERLCEGDR
ncbi:MAG: ATP-binding protein [Chloroflexi bacterium]|nr:ATP-binding protein [Chloroflexota bacterium]